MLLWLNYINCLFCALVATKNLICLASFTSIAYKMLINFYVFKIICIKRFEQTITLQCVNLSIIALSLSEYENVSKSVAFDRSGIGVMPSYVKRISSESRANTDVHDCRVT